LAGFAEDGQSPFAPRKYKTQKNEDRFVIIKEIFSSP
jgi:hypothetical protein